MLELIQYNLGCCILVSVFRCGFLLSGNQFHEFFIDNHLWIYRLYLISLGLMMLLFNVIFVLQGFEYFSVLFLIQRQRQSQPNEIMYNEQFKLKKNMDYHQLPVQVKKDLRSRNKESYLKCFFAFVIFSDVGFNAVWGVVKDT